MKSLISIVCLLFTIACAASNQNVNGYPIEWNKPTFNFTNLSEINNKQLSTILTNEGPIDYYKGKLTVRKIGEVKGKSEKYYVILTELEWGNGRMTTRLVALSDKWHYLGCYGGLPELPERVDGSKIYFPFDEADGNSVDFVNGVPTSAYLDGENFTFDKSLNKSFQSGQK